MCRWVAIHHKIIQLQIPLSNQHKKHLLFIESPLKIEDANRLLLRHFMFNPQLVSHHRNEFAVCRFGF